MNIEDGMRQAIHHHQAGRVADAERIYQQILSQNPNHAGALHLLGVIRKQTGNYTAAIDLIGRSIRLHPDSVEPHNNLGNALRGAGRLDEAVASFQQAIQLRSDCAEAHCNLGNALGDLGRREEAIASFRQAIRFKPNYAEAHFNLASAIADGGEFDQAIGLYQRAIQIKPDYAEAHLNLGILLGGRGEFEQAAMSLRRAIEINPDYAEAYLSLGNSHLAGGRPEQAIDFYHHAIQIQPDLAEAHVNLGVVLKNKGELDQAVISLERAIQLQPDLADAHNNLGNVFKDRGELEDAIAAFRRAIALNPNFPEAHSNLVYVLHFHPDYDPPAILAEHRQWSREHADPLKPEIRSHYNDRSPQRKLKIGYLSPDFREHPVGRFLLPLLQHHDHDHFEIFCYSNAIKIDGVTTKLRSYSDHWRQIVATNDELVASQVRADGIDILIDLAGHTAGNRLPVFARKPAPVQVSYLGYPGSTGLSAIDYRLTDAFADPPGLTDQFQSEKLYRLPQTNWCFTATEDAPPVQAPPASRLGHVTFGSFNNFAKVTESMLKIWARILHQVPDSRLLLKGLSFRAASVRERLHKNFSAHGIEPDRLDLRTWQADLTSHLDLYGEMDIALDTFPYNGTTTTCDALWMGVPVITLAGQTHVSRVGLSLLSNIGLPEMIAKTTKEYISLAVDLARDQDRLKTLRLGLRERMKSSPLMDGKQFAADIEKAYRQMWRAWCAAR